MIEGQASRTALLTAVQRAHHFLTAPEPKILSDDVAFALTGLNSAEEIQAYIDNMVQAFAALSDPETAKVFMARIDGAVCMRSRVVEEELPFAKERGVKQLVILGAGLDSTAYRGLDVTKGLSVFEVDHPATQKWKMQRLTEAGISIPSNLKFVAFDFEAQTLEEALKAGGVNSSEVTFFTWLGVHMYLTDEAVRATLNVLGAFPEDSQMVMDFMSPSYAKAGGFAEQSVADLQKVVSEMGEPMKSKYYEPELEDMLKSTGFNDVRFLNAKWLVDNYLDGNKSVFDIPDEATSILTAII